MQELVSSTHAPADVLGDGENVCPPQSAQSLPRAHERAPLCPLALAQLSRNSLGNLTPRKKTRFRKFPGKSDLRRPPSDVSPSCTQRHSAAGTGRGPGVLEGVSVEIRRRRKGARALVRKGARACQKKRALVKKSERQISYDADPLRMG